MSVDEKHSPQFDINDIIYTLRKAPEERNAIELDKIQSQTRDIPFFKQYISRGDKDVHFKCCKFMKYEHVKKDDTVFLIDTIGTKFYLILKGKVGVYIRLPKKIHDAVTGDDVVDNSLTCVKELFSGEAFGELALLNNKPRLASIVAHDNCFLAVLDKKDFGLILKEKEEQKLLHEMGFFAKLPFFTGWSFNLVKLLYLNAFRVKYKKGDFVFQEGQEPVAVYIITEGQFDLEKTFDKEKRLEFWETEDENRKDIKNMRLLHKKAQMKLRIASYTPHELFGEEDIMNQQQKRTFSALCESATGECIMIKKRDFYFRILREEGAKQYLNQRLLNKNSRMTEKTKSIKDSIYGFQNFLYNDQEGLKKQKEVTSEIFKNETFNEKSIKKFVSQQGHSNLAPERESEGKEQPSPTQNQSPISIGMTSKFAIKRSMTSFMNLFSTGSNQIEHNTPIIPIFEQKKQILAQKIESFSPLLKQSKQTGDCRIQIKPVSNTNINIDMLSSVKNQQEDIEKEPRKINEQSPLYHSPSQTLIKKLSGVFDQEKFNNFKLQLRSKQRENSDIKINNKNQIDLLDSEQNLTARGGKSKEKGNAYESMPDISEYGAQPSLKQQISSEVPQRSSLLSIPVGTQTIIESDKGNENSSTSSDDEEKNHFQNPKSCLSPASPGLKRSMISSQLSISKNSFNLNSDYRREGKNNRIYHQDNNQGHEDLNHYLINRVSNSDKKFKIFENLKDKKLRSNTLTHFNMSNDESKLQKDEITKPMKNMEIRESNNQATDIQNNVTLPKILINKSDQFSPIELSKYLTPQASKTPKSFAQDELIKYKKNIPIRFNQSALTNSNQNSNLSKERQTHTKSIERTNKSSLYYNQIIRANTEDIKKQSLRQANSLERLSFGMTQNRILKEQNSIMAITNNNIQNQSVSPARKIRPFGQSDNSNTNNKTRTELYNKQHIQAGQRLLDIMDRMLLKQQDNSHKTLENIQAFSSVVLKNQMIEEKLSQIQNSHYYNNKQNNQLKVNSVATKYPGNNNVNQEASILNDFKYHVSIGTQFSSLIKQIDQSKKSLLASDNKQQNTKILTKIKLKN